MNEKERALWNVHDALLQAVRRYGYENMDFSDDPFAENLPLAYEAWKDWTDDERRHQRSVYARMINEQLDDKDPVHWGAGSPCENAAQLMVEIIAIDILTPVH